MSSLDDFDPLADFFSGGGVSSTTGSTPNNNSKPSPVTSTADFGFGPTTTASTTTPPTQSAPASFDANFGFGFDTPAPADPAPRRFSFSDLADRDDTLATSPTLASRDVPPTKKKKDKKKKKKKDKDKDKTASQVLEPAPKQLIVTALKRTAPTVPQPSQAPRPMGPSGAIGITLGNLDISAFAKRADSKAKETLENLKPVLGLSFVPAVSPQSGLKVTRVEPLQAAADAGILDGDVILEIAGGTVANSSDFFRIYTSLGAGDRTPFEIIRTGERITIEVMIGGAGYTGVQIKELVRKVEASGGLNLAIDEKTARAKLSAAKKLIGLLFVRAEVGQYKGLLVSEVKMGLPASRAGMEANDLITHIDNQPVRSSEDFYAIWSKAIPGDIFPFTILRGKRQFTVPLTVGAAGYNEVQLRKLRKAANIQQRANGRASTSENTGRIALGLQSPTRSPKRTPTNSIRTLAGPKDTSAPKKKKKKDKKKKKKDRSSVI